MKLELLLDSSKQRLQGVPVITVVGLRQCQCICLRKCFEEECVLCYVVLKRLSAHP